MVQSCVATVGTTFGQIKMRELVRNRKQYWVMKQETPNVQMLRILEELEAFPKKSPDSATYSSPTSLHSPVFLKYQEIGIPLTLQPLFAFGIVRTKTLAFDGLQPFLFLCGQVKSVHPFRWRSKLPQTTTLPLRSSSAPPARLFARSTARSSPCVSRRRPGVAIRCARSHAPLLASHSACPPARAPPERPRRADRVQRRQPYCHLARQASSLSRKAKHCGNTFACRRCQQCGRKRGWQTEHQL